MDYTKTEDMSDSNDDASSVDLSLELDQEEDGGEGGEGDYVDLLSMSKKDKNQGGRFSLQSRRAIEDHIEQRRLHKELDYLFDDDFIEGKEK